LTATTRTVSLFVGVAVVCVIGVWTLSPRFDVDSPSLVDDWWAISRSPDAASVAVRLGDPEPDRYRPGWILWSYVQWHTFDAPGRLIGPNVWNVARLVVLVLGLCLVTTLALPPPGSRREGVILAGLATLPALLVVTVPALAVDFARFGPQEPLLVGAMALGGSLLLLAARSLLLESQRPGPVLTGLLAVAGSAFWIVGVYQKETSICALPFVAAAALAGRARLRSWPRLSVARRVVLAVLGAVVLLPLVHVAVETALIARRGRLVYETELDTGRSALSGSWDLVRLMHDQLSALAVAVTIGALVAVVAAFAVRRALDWLAIGALVSGVLALLVAGQAGVVMSRYYLPTFALCAIALSLSLAAFRPSVQAAAALLIAALALAYVPDARDHVQEWAAGEREWGEFVRSVAEVDATGCPVAVAGFDPEASQAIPVLVSVKSQGEPGGCVDRETYLVVGPNATGAALLHVCPSEALEAIRDWPSGSVYRCGHLASEPIQDPELGAVEPEELVDRRRLRA
jgi:hypothetical protein